MESDLHPDPVKLEIMKRKLQWTQGLKPLQLHWPQFSWAQVKPVHGLPGCRSCLGSASVRFNHQSKGGTLRSVSTRRRLGVPSPVCCQGVWPDCSSQSSLREISSIRNVKMPTGCVIWDTDIILAPDDGGAGNLCHHYIQAKAIPGSTAAGWRQKSWVTGFVRQSVHCCGWDLE